MPVISFSYSDFARLLGLDIGLEKLAERAPMLGCDVNRIEGDEVELEFFPNRPDLYSVEGVARAMRAFLGIRPGMPKYDVNDSNIDLEVDESVVPVRPFVVGGIVRDLNLTDAAVRSLMDMQEKLHLTVGRHRKKVSVGIHDLDKVKPPFTYKAVAPESVRFIPLACSEQMDLQQILQKHEKGREYASILEGQTAYPLIVDREGGVLSFPPIINGVLTQVTEDTKNIFIDVTGTDYPAISLTLNIISTALAERGSRLESVVLRYPKRAPFRTPALLSRKKAVDPAYVARLLGVNMSNDAMIASLKRMMYDADMVEQKIEVGIPAFRNDILHEVDIVEDIAIGHSYSKLEGVLPAAMTAGRELAASFRAERARQVMIGFGYHEMMSFALTSQRKLSWGTGERPGEAAELLNPVVEDQTVLRTAVLPSLLEQLRLNKHCDLPQRLFELGEVVLDGRNRRRLAAVFMHPKANFTEAKSLAEAVMRELGLAGRHIIKPSMHPDFIPGRCASIWIDGLGEAGWFGELHPAALAAFELSNPAGGLELELDGW
jgi:phenylalanyl-tRNA synthetase beta chain